MVWCRILLLGFFASRQPSTGLRLHSPASVFICVFTHLSVAAHSAGISGEGRTGNRILIFKMFHCTWGYYHLTKSSPSQTTAILGQCWRRRMFALDRPHSIVTELICLSVIWAEAVVRRRSDSVARKRSEPNVASTELHKAMSYSKCYGLRNTFIASRRLTSSFAQPHTLLQSENPNYAGILVSWVRHPACVGYRRETKSSTSRRVRNAASSYRYVYSRPPSPSK